MHTSLLPAQLAPPVFESIPYNLAAQFSTQVRAYYIQTALDRYQNDGSVFVVNLDRSIIYDNAIHSQTHPFRHFADDWLKIVCFTLLVGMKDVEHYGLTNALNRCDFVDMMHLAQYDEPHLLDVLHNMTDEFYEDALRTLAEDFCKALDHVRFPFVTIDDPNCGEHGNFIFTKRLHLGTVETLNTPIYYMYPEFKLHNAQREVW